MRWYIFIIIVIILLYGYIYYYCKSFGYEDCAFTRDAILCIQIKQSIDSEVEE